MPCGIFYWPRICGFWVFTVTSGVAFANLLEVGFEPVASKLRASTQASHGSLPCELRLVARPTVLALTGCYLLLKRRRHGSLCTRSDAAFGDSDRFPGSRHWHVFLRLSVLNPGRPGAG
jgi:hypothetical protein